MKDQWNHLAGDREHTEKLLNEYVDYLMANSDADHPAWNLELMRGWKENKWNYIDGCMITGILQLYDITKEEKYLRFADDFLSGFVKEDGSIRTYAVEEYSLDNVNPARNLLTLYRLTEKEKYKKAADLVRSQLDTMPRTPSGSFWHKKIYPDQVWLDGIYMAQPFYMEYEKTFRNGAGLKDACDQILRVRDRMKDPVTGLYYHGYDESRKMYWADPETGLSPNFWLRAIGWFMLGLVDCIAVLQDTEQKSERLQMMDVLKDLAASLKKVQQDNGLYYQLPALPEVRGNYLETSGSALIAAAELKAVRLGILDAEYQATAEKTFYGIVDERLSRNADGTPRLTGICLVSGLGGATHRDGSVEYYLSEPVVENDAKGVGPLLLAYTEMLQRKCN